MFYLTFLPFCSTLILCNEVKTDDYQYVLNFNVFFVFFIGDYVITLSRSLVVPFLTFSDRRDLREKAW